MRIRAWPLAQLALPAFAQEPEGNSLSLGAAYTGDLRRNTTGGMAVGTTYSDAIDLAVTWNSDRLFDDASISSNVAVMYLGGGAISADFVGDLQGINNIEAPSGWRLYESWVELTFGDQYASVRTGVLDLNAEFDSPVTSSLFIGPPFGIGTDLAQTGPRGPVIFPTTGLGIRAAGTLGGGMRWRVGAYDGAPGTDEDAFTSMHLSKSEGALLIGEFEYSSDRIHKLALGSWAYTAPFERVDAALRPEAAPEHGNHGFYGMIDAALGSAGRVDFDGALRAGTAPARFNTFDGYVGVVFAARHLWAERPDDVLGLGIAWGHVGQPYRDTLQSDGSPATSAETLVELTWRAEVAPWLAVVPNVQFVSAPGALQDVNDSWIVGLRFEITQDHNWQLAASREKPADGSYARRE